MLSRFTKILVIGLGKLGLTVIKNVKESGFDVYGYDIKTKAIDRAEKIAEIKHVVDFVSEDFNVFIISVSTNQPDNIFPPQIEGLLSTVNKISNEAKKECALGSIESIIPKGTSKKVFEILNHRFHVVHSAHRWYSLDEKEQGVNQLHVIGGVGDCCLKAGMQYYGVTEEEIYFDITPFSYNSLGIPRHSASNIEIAEITKIRTAI